MRAVSLLLLIHSVERIENVLGFADCGEKRRSNTGTHTLLISCVQNIIHCCIGSNNAKAKKKKKCALIKLDFLAFPLKASGGRENYWHAIA